MFRKKGEKKGRQKKRPYAKFQCGSRTHEVYYNLLKNKVTSVFQYFKVFLQDFYGLMCNCKFPDAPMLLP